METGKAWARWQGTKLRDGQVKRVIGSLKRLQMKTAEKRAQRGEAVRYLRARCEQMNYEA